ncbi:MAG TPA: ThiF family adenylyltransferase [Chroococcales cyanobacterium]
MAKSNYHEELYRGRQGLERLAQAAICICGTGALGSNLAVNLARIGCKKLTLIDRDRVEEHNVGTQTFGLDDVGARKAEILRNLLSYELHLDVQAKATELQANNAGKLLNGHDLVIDCFDNSLSRQIVADHCRDNAIACLHAGVSGEYGEVMWNDRYKVPSDEGLDACDYPLARNLLMLVVAVAAESLIRYLLAAEQESYSITLGDLKINRERER